MNIRKIAVALTLFVLTLSIQAKIEMPRIFSNEMVLQRDMPITVWGWAAAGESVEILFKDQKIKTKADKDGNWNVKLKQSEYGGPYQMTIVGKENTITFTNILLQRTIEYGMARTLFERCRT